MSYTLLGAAAIGAVGSIGGALIGSNSGVHTSAPDPTTTASNAGIAIGNQLPTTLANTSQNAPQYASLYGNMTQQQLLGSNDQAGLLNLYYQGAQGLQGAQGTLNTMQGQQNIGLLNYLGPQAINSAQAADPMLTQIQGQLQNYATNYLNPEQMASSTNWAGGYNQNLMQGLGQNAVQNPQNVNPGNVQAQQIQSSAGTLNGFSPNVQQVNPSMMQSGSIGGVQNVYSPQNQTLNQLNQTAQQQLALGSSVSPQQQATVANQVLSNYNSMGRANDPTAIAGLATGLDTYGQQLLQQREGAAQTAAGLTTNQGSLGLAAQQSNQAANLSAAQSNLGAFQQTGLSNQANSLAAQQSNQNAGLVGSGQSLNALTTQAGLQQQASLANQQASLMAGQYNQQAGLTAGMANQQASLAAGQSNLSAYLNAMGLSGNALSNQNLQGLSAQYANQGAGLANLNAQSGLMSQAAGLDQSVAAPGLNMLMNPSNMLSAAANATGAAGNMATQAQSLQNPYNPFLNGLYSTNYSGQSTANQTNAATNAGLVGGGMSLFGNLFGSTLGAAGQAGGIGNLFGGGNANTAGLPASSSLGFSNTGLGSLNGIYGYCWVARAVYGASNPKWVMFRHWMLNKAPESLRALYIAHGEEIAETLKALPATRKRIRAYMDQILMEAA